MHENRDTSGAPRPNLFDPWIEAWRRKATGDVIVVRYADDLVVGFEDRIEAEQFLEAFRGRLAKFGLELHPEKTRLIEFGRFAAQDRERRGEGKPETFTFLGFTHLCGKRRSNGAFTVGRKTAKKRMVAKLHAIKAELRLRKTQATASVPKKTVSLEGCTSPSCAQVVPDFRRRFQRTPPSPQGRPALRVRAAASSICNRPPYRPRRTLHPQALLFAASSPSCTYPQPTSRISRKQKAGCGSAYARFLYSTTRAARRSPPSSNHPTFAPKSPWTPLQKAALADAICATLNHVPSQTMAAKPTIPNEPSATSLAQFTGTVSRIIANADATWAEIVIDGADNLYREIRVPHPLQNDDGTVTRLKQGDRVNLAVTLAATARPPQRS
jgi:Reverse transcriptase (RNA-dependent DNA polymerase)